MKFIIGKMMKKIYILSTIWMAFIVGACDYNDKNFDGLDDIVTTLSAVRNDAEAQLLVHVCCENRAL